jgi:ADP-ribosylglycohydrolase
MDKTTNGLNAVLGALTADAAALGLHWLYDTDRLAQVAGGQVVFRQPRIEDYEGFTGYFAHGCRKAGDLSHYGESAMVMLRSLAENNGEFAAHHYQRVFKLYFGPGGPFVGYIDNATRITLQNLARIESEAVAAALTAAPQLSGEIRNKLIGQVLPYCRIYSGQSLRAPVERDIRMTGGDDQMVELAWNIVRVVDEVTAQVSGADDAQVSATAKLSPLVACLADRYEAGCSKLAEIIETAVRVTNNNDEAVRYAQLCSVLLQSVIRGKSTDEAIREALASVDPETRKRLEIAVNTDRSISPVQAIKKLGQTCYVSEAIPAVFYLLTHAKSFSEAVIWNIQAGGDSCGRGIILGAVLGAGLGVSGPAGIPLRWLLHLNQGAAALDLLDRAMSGR